MKGPSERIVSVQAGVKVWSSVTEERGRRKKALREWVRTWGNYQMELRETSLVRRTRTKLTAAPAVFYTGHH